MNHPANSSRMVKSGWLKKQGGMVRTWHRRWFVLNGDCLFYFAKEDELRPLGTIYLPGNKVIQHSGIADEAEKFLFEVVPESFVTHRSKSLNNKSKNQTKMGPNHETFLLCANSDEERQEWLRAIRVVMFASQGGAIFGQSLAETMEYERQHGTERKVPFIIEQCVQFLTIHALEIEGIFRLPGRALLIRELVERFDMGEKVKFDLVETDVHSVASLLKQYLRELPECLIPYKAYQQFMNIAMKFQDSKGGGEKSVQVEELRAGMTSIPLDNYNVLKYLCMFLNKVSQKTAINKMSALNLATVFGPNIIRHPNMEDNPSIFMLTTADISQQLAYMLINHNDQVFTMDFQGDSKTPVPVEDLLGFNSDNDIQSSNMQAPLMPSSALDDLKGIAIEHPRDRHARSIPNSSLLLQMRDFDINKEPESPSPVFEEAQTPVKDRKRQFDAKGKPIPPIRKKQIRKKGGSSGSSSPDLNSGNRTPDPTNNGMPQLTNAGPDQGAEIATLRQQLDEANRELVAKSNKLKMVQGYKSNSEERVKTLSADREKMQAMYEQSIKSLETMHKKKVDDLYAKLEEEKSSKSTALQKILELQTKVQKYQMKYGSFDN